MTAPTTGSRRAVSARLTARYEPLIAKLRGSDTAKAAGLALAMIANNVIALGSTVVFARLLSDYGSLAALISYFLILSVAGQALQVATAREGVLGHLGVGAELVATLKTVDDRRCCVFTVVLTVVSVLLREPIAAAVGVKHSDQWAAAIGVPAGCMWLGLSILRGALQGIGDYKSVGLSLVGEQAVGWSPAPRWQRSGSASPARTWARRSRSSRWALTARCALRRYAATVESGPGRAPPGPRSACGRTSAAPGRRSPGWS